MIHRAGTPLVNWYLLEEGGHVTIVDAALSGYRPQLEPALKAIGRRVEDVEAVVLTHAHVDHIGFAPALQNERGTPVYVHVEDVPQAATGRAPATEAPLLPALLRHRTARRVIRHLVANGAARPPKLASPTPFADGDVLDVPGRPVAIHVPGHSPGMSVLHVPSEGALFTGDALSGWSTITGKPGPILPPVEFNHDSERAKASLDRIEPLAAETLHYGHGDPWTRGAAQAVAIARENRDR